jgi:hypothetical protein
MQTERILQKQARVTIDYLIDYTDPNYKKYELTSELIRALYEKHKKPRFENKEIGLGQCTGELVPLLVGALS